MVLSVLAQAFYAGVVSNAESCTYPVSAGFAATLLAVAANPTGDAWRGWRDILYVPAAILGFAVSFIVLNADLYSIHGVHGMWLVKRGFGAGIVAFGLWLIALGRKPALSIRRPLVYAAAAAMIGVLFASEWIPCAGAVLGKAMDLAGDPDTRFDGMARLFMYAWGIGCPVIIVGAALHAGLRWPRLARPAARRALGVVSAAALAAVGWLVMTGNFNALARLGAPAWP